VFLYFKKKLLVEKFCTATTRNKSNALRYKGIFLGKKTIKVAILPYLEGITSQVANI
jgi:hypothetical protein